MSVAWLFHTMRYQKYNLTDAQRTMVRLDVIVTGKRTERVNQRDLPARVH